MSEDDYVKMKRVFALILGIVTFSLGARFSYNGFGEIAPEAKWLGLALVLVITGVEIVWNGEGLKHSIGITMAALLFCYPYGIYTNFLGLLQLTGDTLATASPEKTVIMAFVAPMLEILPEALVVYGLVGRAHLGDFLDNLVGGRFASKSTPATATHQATATNRTLGGK